MHSEMVSLPLHDTCELSRRDDGTSVRVSSFSSSPAVLLSADLPALIVGVEGVYREYKRTSASPRGVPASSTIENPDCLGSAGGLSAPSSPPVLFLRFRDRSV